MLAAARGTLDTIEPLVWDERTAVAVVLASAGYPESSSKGDVITGVDAAEAEDAVSVLHAGTALNNDGELITAGGRVLAVVGLGEDLNEARETAYEGVGKISFDGAQHRSDIALKAARGEITVPSVGAGQGASKEGDAQ